MSQVVESLAYISVVTFEPLKSWLYVCTWRIHDDMTLITLTEQPLLDIEQYSGTDR